jgi:hypothetical protein
LQSNFRSIKAEIKRRESSGIRAVCFSKLKARSRPYAHRRMISVALIPPNPNEFDSATSKLCGTALFGT